MKIEIKQENYKQLIQCIYLGNLNAYIEFFELHKNQKLYELHFLMMTKDSNLVEYFHYVTYRFRDMRFVI